MINKALFLIPLCMILLQSCDNKPKIQGDKPSQKNISTSIENTEKDPKKTLDIKYMEHKNLLDILTKLPDSTMESWGWPQNARYAFVKFIEKNNFTTRSSKYFSKISLLNPNALQIQVVDGYWILEIYRIKQNNYIVITNDVVGDGNDLHSFEYNNGKLNAVKFENLLDEDYLSRLLIDKNNTGCVELLEDNRIGFEYDFTRNTKLKISNSSSLKEDENKNCFQGNALTYTFNPGMKKFDLAEISWTKTQN